jgi:hypothetical protein
VLFRSPRQKAPLRFEFGRIRLRLNGSLWSRMQNAVALFGVVVCGFLFIVSGLLIYVIMDFGTWLSQIRKAENE